MKRVIFKYSLILGIVISISFCLFSQNQRRGYNIYMDNLYVPMINGTDYPITNIFYHTPQLLTYYMENYVFTGWYVCKSNPHIYYYLRVADGNNTDALKFRTAYASEQFLEINDSITNYLLNRQLYDYTIKYFLDDEFLYGSNAYDIVKVNKDDVRNYTLICDTLNKEILVDICLNQKSQLRRYDQNKIHKVELNCEIKEIITNNILMHNQLDFDREILEVTFHRYYSTFCMTIRNISKEEMKYYDNYFTGFDIVDDTVIVLRMLTDAFEYIDKIEKDTLSINQLVSKVPNENRMLYHYRIIDGKFERD